MKKILYLMLAFLVLHSCKKDTDSKENETKPKEYINVAEGSVWQYHEVNNSNGTSNESNYSVTSTSRDTLIDGKNYHVYNYSYGGNQFLNKTGKDYFEFSDFIDLGKSITRLYVKEGATVNTQWDQTETIPVTEMQIPVQIKISNQIVSIGTRSVEGKDYEKVIQVKTTLSSPDVPAEKLTTDINSYFAPDYGMIENTSLINLNYLGFQLNIDLKTTLTSATLK